MVGTNTFQADILARPIGAVLRSAMQAHKPRPMGVRELAGLMDMDHSILSRYLTGKRRPSKEMIARMATAIGLSEQQVGALVASADPAIRTQWIATPHQDRETQQRALVTFEGLASRITIVHSQLIPGLLQTPDYTRAIMHADPDVPSWEVEDRVEFRARRPLILTRMHNPAQLTALIGQEALTRVIGGPETMHDQLLDLWSWAAPERANVDIRIIPHNAGYYSGLTNAYSMLGFLDGQEDIVYVETVNTGLFFYEEADVAAHRRGVDKVLSAALSPEDSREMIAETARQFETESEIVA